MPKKKLEHTAATRKAHKVLRRGRRDGSLIAEAHCMDPRIACPSPLPFQRDIRERHVKKLLDDFKPGALAMIQAILFNALWHIADGQHRVEAARLWDGGDPILILMVHNVNTVLGRPLSHKITRADANRAGAEVFRRNNIGELNTTAYENFMNAMDIKDPVALRATKLVTTVGYSVTKSGQEKNSVSCPSELLKGARDYPVILERALGVSASLMKGIPLPRNLIRALTTIQLRGVERGDGNSQDPLSNYNMNRLARKFGAEAIAAQMKSPGVGGTTQRVPAELFLELLNKDKQPHTQFRLLLAKPPSRKKQDKK